MEFFQPECRPWEDSENQGENRLNQPDNNDSIYSSSHQMFNSLKSGIFGFSEYQPEIFLSTDNFSNSNQEVEESNIPLNILNYIWGTVIGDWNNNSDFTQDIVNIGAGLIPIVDRVLDVRDLAAHFYYMIFKKDYANPMRWIALARTIVGAI